MSDPLRNDLITLTTDLIRFRSTADQPDEIVAAMQYVTHYLEHIPGLYLHHSESHGKPALVVTLHDTHAPTLMLNGHLDVIPAQEHQFEPYIHNGRIYGRASQDMKGSVAVLLRLIKALATQEPRPNVGVQFVSDEEIGGEQGTGRLLQEGWTCGLFIAAEPTDMRICNEQKGIIWLELRLHGTPAHGSRPWEGHNPLHELATGMVALSQRFPTPGYEAWSTTVTPTMVQSGGNRVPNQIPPTVLLTLDIRHIAEDTPDDIVAAIQACFPHAELVKNKNARALFTPSDTPIVQQLAKANEEIRGEPIIFYREHFGSDARFYSAAGIPAVCFGPVGMGMHSDEEWVTIESLMQLYHVLLRTASAV